MSFTNATTANPNGDPAIPSALGYGSSSVGGGLIPPNSALVFDVELLSVQ